MFQGVPDSHACGVTGFGLPNRRKRVFVLASLHGDARDVLLAQVIYLHSVNLQVQDRTCAVQANVDQMTIAINNSGVGTLNMIVRLHATHQAQLSVRPYRDAQDKLLWMDKTCPARN